MAGRFNREIAADQDSENSQENSGGGDSPRSGDAKIASTSSSRRSRRAVQKRVVSVPLKDLEGFRLKGDPMSAPPSDSWAWRKYGQKPIKGSPYPRGYYRCSSSKGCPARKQVERSRDDPKMLVVTYSCEHNHPWPASRNTHHKGSAAAATAAGGGGGASAAVAANSASEEEEEEDEKPQLEEQEEEKKLILTNPQNNQSQEAIPDYKFMEGGNEFGIGSWMSDFECTMLESTPILADDRIDTEMEMIFTMREDDESLFAGLGELPECSTVFRRGMVEREAVHRRPPGLATTT